MPFSFGGGRSTSTTRSSSSSVDASIAGSVSGGQSTAGSQSQSRQNIAFDDVFARLFGGAEGAAAGLDPSMLTNTANQLFSGGADFMGSLMNRPGQEFLANRVSGESPVLQEQIDALGSDIGRFLAEDVNPTIEGDAIAAGALGGGRQGVAQGRAADAATREFARGAMGLRAADITARDQAAGVLGAQTIQSAQTGLSGLTPMAALGEMGFGASLAPYERLASILGPQVALTSSDASSFSTSEDFARSFSAGYGQSQARSRTDSETRDLRLGFGG